MVVLVAIIFILIGLISAAEVNIIISFGLYILYLSITCPVNDYVQTQTVQGFLWGCDCFAER